MLLQKLNPDRLKPKSSNVKVQMSNTHEITYNNNNLIPEKNRLILSISRQFSEIQTKNVIKNFEK